MHRSIVRLGHPALRFAAQAVKVERLADDELIELVGDLRKALAESAARAITAPQLGVELQILAYRPTPGAQGAEASQIRLVVNPMLEPEHGDLVYDWESCLSIPDLKGLVPRYPKVRLRGVDEVGQAIDVMAEGQQARLFQHAHDHLSGVVFLDRMRDLRSLAFGQEWSRYLSGAEAPVNEQPGD